MTPFPIQEHWLSRPSPNHSARKKAVSAIVMHADASGKASSSLDWIRRAESQVSYHILIDRDGTIYSVVSPDRKAWHAGRSAMDTRTDCNQFSVGVCLSNKNDGVEKYPDAQVSAGVFVCALLCQHYGIDPLDIVSHAAIATPAGRKTDPKGLDIAAFRVRVRVAL
jgi:N-acetyl-anhydromuramyl-L-alanine amidase AmpD